VGGVYVRTYVLSRIFTCIRDVYFVRIHIKVNTEYLVLCFTCFEPFFLLFFKFSFLFLGAFFLVFHFIWGEGGG
jgi:hypothetical protein